MNKLSYLPLLSIVVPVYNCKKYIRATMLSLIRIDKILDIEVIIQNSNSTDGTTEIIEECISGHENFSHCKEKDLGQSDAINKGTGKARGKWVTWLCADDLLLDDFVKMFKPEDSGNIDVIYGDVVMLQDNNISYAIGTEKHEKGKIAKTRLFVQQPGTCILKKRWDEINGLNLKLNWTMDYDLFLRLERLSCNFKRYEMFVAVARIHDEAKTSSGSIRRLREHYKVIRRAQSAKLSLFSLKPYTAYTVEYVIKKLESSGREVKGIGVLHRLFWKITKPTEIESIKKRFEKDRKSLQKNIDQLEVVES